MAKQDKRKVVVKKPLVQQTTKPLSKEEKTDKAGKDFVTNWIAHPETRKRYRANMNELEGTKNNNLGTDNAIFQKGLVNLKNTKSTFNKAIPNITGSYQNKKIDYYGTPTVGTTTHEQTHATEDISNNLSRFGMQKYGLLKSLREKYPGENTEGAIQKEFNTGKYGTEGVIEQASYMGSNGELYPRIMEMRQFLNVTPGQHIDDNMVKKLNADPKTSKTARFYKPEKLKEILNTIASKDTTSDNTVSYAKYGGKIKEPIEQKKDNTTVNKPYIKTPTRPLISQKKEQKRLAIVRDQNHQGVMYPTKKQGKVSKAWDILSHPATALELATKGHILDNFVKGMQDGNIKRNNLDIATDVVNPIAMVDYTSGLPKDIKEGNYGQALLKGASMLPMAKVIGKEIQTTAKGLKTPTNLIKDYKAPAIPYKEQALPKNMEPYLSRYEKPISKEQEIFESFLDANEQNKRVNNRTVHLDNKGKEIPAPKDYGIYKREFKDGGLMKKQAKVPKHIWGALLGTAASVGMGLINNAKQKKAELAASREEYSTNMSQQMITDRQALDEFKDDKGVGVVDYYQAKGGKLAIPSSYNTKGGKLNPISSDMELAKGNKHSESKIDNTSGIKLLQGNKPFAEIEDGETIKDGVKVYSDKLTVDGKNTYADVAKKLAIQKSKIEQNVQKGDKITMATNKRKLALLDNKEDSLFAMQEASKAGTSKATTNIPKGFLGLNLSNKSNQSHEAYKADLLKGFNKEEGNTTSFANSTVGKGVNTLLPMVDNIVNGILTSKTPKIRKPQLIKPANFKTSVNVNPQLNAVADAVATGSTSIMRNTSNSSVARNSVAATKLAGAKQSADIYANKENTETGLKNQEAQNAQQVSIGNAATMNQYADKKLARLDDIQGRISANVSNFVGDVIDKRNFDAQQDYNKEQLDVVRNTYNVGNTTLRADLNNPTEIEKMKSDPTYLKEQMERYKDSPRELEKFYQLFPNARPTKKPTYATPNFNNLNLS